MPREIVRVLTFSHYRIEYAREINEMLTSSTYRGETLEYVMILMYANYLFICGVDDLAKQVKEYEPLVRKYKDVIGLNYNEQYDEGAVKSINDAIDVMYHKYFKT